MNNLPFLRITVSLGLAITSSAYVPLASADQGETGPLSPTHQRMIESLRSGKAIGQKSNSSGFPSAPPAICFAHGTDPSVVAAITEAAQEGYRKRAGGDNGLAAAKAFRTAERWEGSSLSSPPLEKGDSLRLSWGFVADGVMVPDLQDNLAPSDFIAVLNSIYGSDPTSTAPQDQPWFRFFQDTFDRWETLTGIQYIYEPNDDGATFPTTGGARGVRPDIRISGTALDGPSMVLAFNMFPPEGGDMIFDTTEVALIGDTTGDSLILRNIIAHEHGHGLGLLHVCPLDETKLMEPLLATAFDGPQVDDVFSAHRLYGDRLEDANSDFQSDNNDTLGRATNLGLINTSLFLANLSVDGNSDFSDYYGFTIVPGVAPTVTVTPVGNTYLEGGQLSLDPNSSPDDPTFFTDCIQDTSMPFVADDQISQIDTAIISNLSFQIFGENGTLLFSQEGNPEGVPETASNIALPNGAGPYFLRVFGSQAGENQLYDLQISTAAPVIAQVSVGDTVASEASGTLEFPLNLDGPTSSDVTVGYRLVGEGYMSTVTNTVSIPAGQEAAIIQIPVEKDSTAETNETLNLLLTGVTNAAISDGEAQALVIDDDAPDELIKEGARITGVADRGLTIRWPSVPGRTYRVEASSDLKNWTTLEPDILADGEEESFSPPMGTLHYYRVRDIDSIVPE